MKEVKSNSGWGIGEVGIRSFNFTVNVRQRDLIVLKFTEDHALKRERGFTS